MSEVIRRNIAALHQASLREQSRMDELVRRLESLENRVTMQETELQSQRQQIVRVLVSRGRGPTA